MERMEKGYVKFIENGIRKAEKGALFFDPGSARSADIAMLTELINTQRKRKETALLKKQKKPVAARDEREARRLLEKSGKGAVILWKDQKGVCHILVNTGKGQALPFRGSPDKKTLQTFMGSAALYAAASDVRRVYGSLNRPQMRELKRDPPEKLFAFERRRQRGAGFEAQFKDAVRSIGSASSPLHTAQAITVSMDQAEKRSLSRQLSDRGVRNEADLKALLTKWQKEALENPPLQKTRLRHRQNGYSLSR